MIDPISSLAFSMQSCKGIYAILLGSGVSRAARIPTGWEVTLELVRKVAQLESANCEPDPAAWFTKAKGVPPDYSQLLDAAAKTPAERQQLLKKYFEPSDAEREEGAKLPTKAHRAIAELVKLGYVRVVLTTNFDRLLEVALQDVGVQPTVLSSDDHIQGAMPLIHTQCTVIKLHGDYLDTRIKNTPEELERYSEPLNRLIDRVFDEFGLIVSGWSADWDDALRAAIIRAPSRRFSTYWSSRGEPSAKAKDLIVRRSATVVQSADADSFFVRLSENVKALEEFSRPHPLSTAAAVAALKKYLSEPKYLIAHNDLICSEGERVRRAFLSEEFSGQKWPAVGEEVLKQLKSYEAASETLVELAFVAGQWCDDTQFKGWSRMLSSLSHTHNPLAAGVWLNLQRYPAALTMYAFCLGAMLNDNLAQLSKLLAMKITGSPLEDARAVESLNIYALHEHGTESMRVLPGRKSETTPLHNHVKDYLSSRLLSNYPSDVAFEYAFDKLEIVLSLAYAAPTVAAVMSDRYRTLVSAYGWRHANRIAILAELRADITARGPDCPYVSLGLIGRDVPMAEKNMGLLEGSVSKLNWH